MKHGVFIIDSYFLFNENLKSQTRKREKTEENKRKRKKAERKLKKYKKCVDNN